MSDTYARKESKILLDLAKKIFGETYVTNAWFIYDIYPTLYSQDDIEKLVLTKFNEFEFKIQANIVDEINYDHYTILIEFTNSKLVTFSAGEWGTISSFKPYNVEIQEF